MASHKTTALTVNECGKIQLDQPEGEQLRTVTAFFIFGTLIFANFSLIIASAQDILAGTLIPTSTVLVANIAPGFIVTFIAPYFMQKIPYIARITVFCCADIGGLLMLALAN